MKKHLVIVISIVIILATPIADVSVSAIQEAAVAKAGQDVLTNDSITKMVKAGLSDTVIITMVETQPGKYLLGADDIIALKQAGVSEKIITAMLKTPASPGTVPAPRAACATDEDRRNYAARFNKEIASISPGAQATVEGTRLTIHDARASPIARNPPSQGRPRVRPYGGKAATEVPRALP
jgi:hypothetical protein